VALFDNQAARLDRSWRQLEEKRSKALMKDSHILRTQYRVSDFVAWQRDRALELNPNFQRRPVWKKGAKSYLIDTIIRGLPIPIIFLRDVRSDLKTFKAKRDVVDGQQRIRTILSFIDPSLLSDFDAGRDDFTISKTHNEELAGLRFNKLPEEYKQRILDYQFSVHSFPADTDDREILQIFARMNATGVKLNAQELRNAEFYGEFKKCAYDLATEQLNRWREWGIFTPDQIARMNEVELSSEFMLLILNGILEKNNSSLDYFYENFDPLFADGKEVARRFRATFDTIENQVGKETVVKFFSNRTTFYSLFVAIYASQYELRSLGTKEYKPLKRERGKTIKADVITQIKAGGERIQDRSHLPSRESKALRGATTHASERKVVVELLLGGNSPWRGQN
jgi:hypothetical protein